MARRRSKKQSDAAQFYKIVAALISTVVILFIIFKFFGPKIGSAFLLISKNRNEPVDEDVIPPSVPLFSKVPEATNKETVNLNGVGEPGATIELYVNGPMYEKTTVNNEGLFTFAGVELNKGSNTLFAKAIDQNSNKSKKSRTFKIVYDDEAPELTVTSPQNGETIENSNKRILIEGETNERVDVIINGRYAIVKSDNTFELLLGVEEGTVGIEVKATDQAGNETVKELSINFVEED